MKYRPYLTTALFLALAAAGCSQKDPSNQKIENVGVIEVTDGMPSRQVLPDGQVFIFTPTILSNGKIKVAITTGETNAVDAKTIHTLTSYFPADQSITIGFDNDTLINFTLHKAKP